MKWVSLVLVAGLTVLVGGCDRATSTQWSSASVESAHPTAPGTEEPSRLDLAVVRATNEVAVTEAASSASSDPVKPMIRIQRTGTNETITKDSTLKSDGPKLDLDVTIDPVDASTSQYKVELDWIADHVDLKYRPFVEKQQSPARPGSASGTGKYTLNTRGRYTFKLVPPSANQPSSSVTLVIVPDKLASRPAVVKLVKETISAKIYTSPPSPANQVLLNPTRTALELDIEVLPESKGWFVFDRDGKPIVKSSTSNVAGGPSVVQTLGITPLVEGRSDDFIVVDSWSGEVSLPVRVIVPRIDSPIRPSITQSSNVTRPAEARLFTPTNIAASGSVRVAKASPNEGSSIRLLGQNAVPSGQLRFVAFVGNSTPFARRLEDPRVLSYSVQPNGNWDAIIELQPANAGESQNLQVFALTTDVQSQQYSDPITVSLLNSLIDASPANITNMTPSGSATITPVFSTTVRDYLINSDSLNLTVQGSTASLPVALYDGDVPIKGGVLSGGPPSTVSLAVANLVEGKHTFRIARLDGLQRSDLTEAINVEIGRVGPRVAEILPSNFGAVFGPGTLTIRFQGNTLNPDEAKKLTNYKFFQANRGANPTTDLTFTPANTPTIDYEPTSNTVTFRFPEVLADRYRLVIQSSLKDRFGNAITGTLDWLLTRSGAGAAAAAEELPPPVRGPYVTFPEFTPPREIPNGFNPSDKVETRVVRLYYYRDAHRVAQIVNRNVESYNRVRVEARRRQAGEAIRIADGLTDGRRRQEVKSVRAAQDLRESEKALREAEQRSTDLERQAAVSTLKATRLRQRLDVIQQEITNLSGSTDPADVAQVQELKKQQSVLQLEFQAEQDRAEESRGRLPQERNTITSLQKSIQDRRATMVQESDQTLEDTQLEDRAREKQFRLEVAAAHEDPDTYAPGKVESKDPVEQVSVSVIGESEIQLRGPIKGINVIRIMINQIDQPVGQVSIAIHTAQINGEHGDRMEVVADKIQKYVDHSRFLTMQSGQMLRNAVVKVASRRATEAAALCAGQGQTVRDAKYIEAFFGEDFIHELRVIDSEFLMSGNKVLSLHSMDTTSLASALFLLALAKNDTRQEILAEFDRMVTVDLPAAELNYYQAGQSDWARCKPHERMPLLAANARFQSLKGYFNHELEGDNTLSPIQREFIRLAQIFKSRLVTELEYQQRVKERALIEERLGNRLDELKLQKEREDQAQLLLQQVQAETQTARMGLLTLFTSINAKIDLITQKIQGVQRSVAVFQEIQRQTSFLIKRSSETQTPLPEFEVQLETTREGPSRVRFRFVQTERGVAIEPACDPEHWQEWISRNIGNLRDARDLLQNFVIYNPVFVQLQETTDQLSSRLNDAISQSGGRLTPEIIDLFYCVNQNYSKILGFVSVTAKQILTKANKILVQLGDASITANASYQEWIAVKESILNSIKGNLREDSLQLIQEADNQFRTLIQADLKLQFANKEANEKRRPLDHKKLLDMLIDDMEEKLIELLEGTRSHTAVVDGYIKSIATALDDDFNTQFYNPAFRKVREASRYWDVSLSQIETTRILTNNRTFAKVEPQATMEFDLPKRDILVTEAMKGAKAMVDEYGALLNDPSFLALSKLRSGQPTSSLAQGTTGGGSSPMRNVLPGLPRLDDEEVLRQAGPGRREFGSALEALIPDPAIYKFETGTGYEIRPVLQPDGQAVVFHFNYMYTTNVREPVRPDEKHLGRVKRHFIDTDVQLSNYELREVSRYTVALKASRTSRGVPLFEDIPALGVLFRPLPSAESSLQQNVILGQSTIFPTLFDLMGLRWAPAVADLDTLRLRNSDFIVRSRNRDLSNRVYDISTSRVDDFLRVPPAERRTDLYRTQETIPQAHPDGYRGPGLNLKDSQLKEGYPNESLYPPDHYIPRTSREVRPGTPASSHGFLPDQATPGLITDEGVIGADPGEVIDQEGIPQDYGQPGETMLPMDQPQGGVILPDQVPPGSIPPAAEPPSVSRRSQLPAASPTTRGVARGVRPAGTTAASRSSMPAPPPIPRQSPRQSAASASPGGSLLPPLPSTPPASRSPSRPATSSTTIVDPNVRRASTSAATLATPERRGLLSRLRRGSKSSSGDQ